MSYNEDGERELVLGNRQLLAIFFVAALLCGVFFAVGYVVGGNSTKAGAATAANTTDGDNAQATEGKREEPLPSAQLPADTSTAASGGYSGGTGTTPAAEPRVADNPAATGAQPVSQTPAQAPQPTTAPVPVATAPAPAPVPYVQPAPRATPPAATAAAASTPPVSKPGGKTVFVSVPETGASYWQIEAIERPTADDLVNTLREGKLPAIMAESPKPGLFRVLVGPYRSQLTLADAKKKLSELGFNSPIIQKY